MNTPKKFLIFFLILVVFVVGGLSVISRSKKVQNAQNAPTQTSDTQKGKEDTGEDNVTNSGTLSQTSTGIAEVTETGGIEPTGKEECDDILTDSKFQKAELVKTYNKLVNVSDIKDLKAEYRAVKELPLRTYNLSDPYYAGNEEGLLFMNLYANGNLNDIDAAYSSKKIDAGSYAKLKSFVTGKDNCGEDKNCRISFNIFTSIKENNFSFPTTLDMSHWMEFYVFKDNKPQEYLKNLQNLIVTECKKQLKK